MKGNQFEQENYLTGTIGRNKLLNTAEAFQELAGAFANLPKRKNILSEPDLNHIFEELGEKFCKECTNCKICWEKNYYHTYRATYELLEEIDKGGDIRDMRKPLFLLQCLRAESYLEEAVKIFRRERLNLTWNNRLFEVREAVTQQLMGMSEVVLQMRDALCFHDEANVVQKQKIKLALKGKKIVAQSVLFRGCPDQKIEIWLTARTKHDRCIPIREIAAILSGATKRDMVPEKNSKAILNGEFTSMVFVEETRFKVLYGVSRRTKEQESISGDHFSCFECNYGEMVLCLSDGMGSGLVASKESEMVIDLLEQLIEAGFSKTTAIQMINSMLVVRSDEPLFTTVDLCGIDLYHGSATFYKSGASATFIKHQNRIEVVPSKTLPLGVVQHIDVEPQNSRLKDGDLIVMLTDGVLDVFSEEESEGMMISLLESIQSDNPREVADEILQYVESYAGHIVKDDMTVLVAGIWAK